MGQIYPFRNPRQDHIGDSCEICGEEFLYGEMAYAVISDNRVDGFVCESCFAIVVGSQQNVSVN